MIPLTFNSDVLIFTFSLITRLINAVVGGGKPLFLTFGQIYLFRSVKVFSFEVCSFNNGQKKRRKGVYQTFKEINSFPFRYL